MKGILKIYHPDETLKYFVKKAYCKAVYSNENHFLEIEIVTDDGLDHVDDDSLQYNFPQLCFEVFDFPIDSKELAGKSFEIMDTDEDQYTEVDLFDDEEAYLYDSKISFSLNEEGELEAMWNGEIDDFYTGSDEPIAFKLKCNFREDHINIDEE